MERMIVTDSRTMALAKAIPDGNPVDLLKLYAVVQSVHRRMEESNWKYPHALLRNEHDRIFKKVDFEKFGISFIQTVDFPSVFNEIYHEIAGMRLEDFMMSVLPHFVAQPERAFPLLDKVRVFEYKCLALILAKIEWHEEFFEASYKTGDYASLIKGIFSEDEWDSFLYAVNCYAYDYVSKTMAAAHNAHKILDERHCTDEFQIELYGEVREKIVKSWTGKKREWRSRIYDTSHYMRAIHGHNPKIDFFDIENVINQAAEFMGNIDRPTEFLKTVLVKKQNDDSKLENGFIAEKIFSRISDADRLLIVNPSPDFLEQYPEKFLAASTFVVRYRAMAWVLEHQFPMSRFVSFEDVQSDDVLSVAETESEFTKALYFSRSINEKEQSLLLRAVENALEKAGIFFGVMPAKEITGEGEFTKKFFFKRIDLLPQTAFNSVPKKKVLVEASLDVPADEFVRMMDYEFLKNAGKKSYLMGVSPETVLVSRQQLATTLKSIYTVYRQQAGKSTESTGKQQLPTPVAFSTEITFWYKTSTGENTTKKVEAYTCYLPTEQQKKRRLLTRGRIVKGAYASVSTLAGQEEIEKWCRFVLPYKSSIHQGVAKAFEAAEGKRLLKSGDVSLKTFWYLQLDPKKIKIKRLDDLVLDPKELYADPRTRSEAKLFCSPVGNLLLNADAEEFYDAMEQFCADKEIEEVSFSWSLLDSLLKYAQKLGYIKNNPVEMYAQTFREKRDNAIANVRAALVKKTFRHEEEQKLIQYLLTTIPKKWENLCVLIRVFTGLEPNVISALTWKDIHEVAGTGVCQLWIYQQFTNGGELPVPLENGEDYRRIPIVPTLYNALQERLNDIKNKTSLTTKELNELQIVASDAQVLNKVSKKVTPRKINELSRKAIEAIGIPENIVDLPDMSEETGTKETNFSAYRGDIFRSNIRFRMIECGFTDSEIRYVLGLSQTTPYGKNYCDYLNDFLQLSLFQKLCRWDIASAMIAETRFYSKKLPLPLEVTLPAGSTKASVLFEVPMNKRMGILTAQVESHYGFGVQAALIRDCGGDDDGGNYRT